MTYEAMLHLVAWYTGTRSTRRGESVHHVGYVPAGSPKPRTPVPGRRQAPIVLSETQQALIEQLKEISVDAAKIAERRIRRSIKRARETQAEHEHRLAKRRARKAKRKQRERGDDAGAAP